ncbi:auxin-responsive protein IAA29 [Quercus robur]|uniref:auxin-responsive protein IAA29 n=1 Tax=Quercus robur TaxID=38942 RepID=UPI002163E7B1|nr:auxin-responsive protein IAA29 [Quercus robur]
MELQLALALPVHNSVKGFDLNDGGIESKEPVASQLWSYGGSLESKKCLKNKRSSEEAFGKMGGVPQIFPLMVWSGQPNEEDDRKGQNRKTSSIVNKNEVEENHVVGWPPIKSWMKKQLHQQQQQQHQGGRVKNDGVAERSGGRNSLYVKVKMEGQAIARKIDLRLFHSYQALTNTLISMFEKEAKFDKNGVNYTLTYQDKEGDWLLAGDVPWQTFIESVQRLGILRNGG